MILPSLALSRPRAFCITFSLSVSSRVEVASSRRSILACARAMAMHFFYPYTIGPNIGIVTLAVKEIIIMIFNNVRVFMQPCKGSYHTIFFPYRYTLNLHTTQYCSKMWSTISQYKLLGERLCAKHANDMCHGHAVIFF